MPAERKNSRETVSETVRSLLMELVNEETDLATVGYVGQTRLYNRKLREMAAYIGVSPEYMPVKLKKCFWELKDLDKMSDYFDIEPADFLTQGSHIHHREKRKHD